MTRQQQRYASVIVVLLLCALSCSGSSATTASGGDGAETSDSLTLPTTRPATTALSTVTAPTSNGEAEPVRAPVRTGAERMVEDQFASVAGLRVGLIVNQTSVVDGVHLIDHVHDSDVVELAAIFAPEHGVRGVADAGEAVGDTIDTDTGVTVFSLYGSSREPTAEMLSDVDVLIYDLQDVGTRFYTYISTMGLAMQAANRAGIRFVVLDRPNPLGGAQIAGFGRDDAQASFVGLYPIPAVYGLTAGELATATVAEGWLDGLEGLDLDVIEVEGWDRSHRWHETGLEWIAPSPGLPTADAALVYPSTVLFETTALSYGKGTLHPFTTIGAPWVDGPYMAETLNDLALAGVRFEPVVFTPDPSIAPNPRLSGQESSGVRFVLTDRDAFDPMEVGAHVLVAFQSHAEDRGVGSIVDRTQIFDLLAGTSEYRRLLDSGASADELIAAWQSDATAFTTLRTPHLLY